MALIRRAVPCVIQPQPDSALNINWANPLTRRLGIAVIPWSNQQHVDVLTGHFKKQTYWTQKGTEIGRALYFSGSSADSYISNGPTWAASTEAATLVGVIERFSTGDTTGDDRTVSIRTSSIHAIAIGYSGTNGWYSTAKPTGLTSTLIPGTIDTSVRAVAVARYNPATGEHDLWINGVQVAAATNTPANWQADFNNGGGGTASRSRGYYLSAGFGRWLSDTEVKEISRNPWQLFVQQRPFAFDASAGGAVSITGTLSVVESSDTFAANGSISHIGTFSSTEASDTFAASGFVTHVGVFAATETGDVTEFSGTVGTIGITGTISVTEVGDIPAFSGTITHTGIFSSTEAADVVAFSGTITHTGTLTATEAGDVLAMADTVSVAPVLYIDLLTGNILYLKAL